MFVTSRGGSRISLRQKLCGLLSRGSFDSAGDKRVNSQATVLVPLTVNEEGNGPCVCSPRSDGVWMKASNKKRRTYRRRLLVANIVKLDY